MAVINGDSIYNGLEAPEASFKASYNVTTGTHTNYNDILEAYNDGQNILLEVKWGPDSSNDVSYCVLNKIFEVSEIRFRGIVFRKDWFSDILILPTNVFQIKDYYFTRPEQGQNGYVLTIGSNYNVMQWSRLYPYHVSTGSTYLQPGINKVTNGVCKTFKNVYGIASANVEIQCSISDNECPFINLIIEAVSNFTLSVSCTIPSLYFLKRVNDDYNLLAGKKYSLTVIGQMVYLDEVVYV